MISAGGTGGGVYPALAVADALRTLYANDLKLTFVGARGDMARDLVDREDVIFDGYYEVLAGPLHGIPRVQQVINVLKIIIGVLHAIILAIRLRPQVVFLTGGWVGFPMAAACWLVRVPIVIYVPDVEPGLTLKLLGRYFAKAIATTVQHTEEFYAGRNVVATGYPLRSQVLEADRDVAIEAFGLDPDRYTLLVFGGSRGSRSINTAFVDIASELIAQGVQILHISGRLDWDQVEADHAALTENERAQYQIFSFLPDIGQAFAAADLVISRAGAATLAEYPELSLPAILVPYPYTWRYQKVNADWLVERGAAIRLDDERLEEELLPTILALFAEPQKLNMMRSSMAALKRSDGAENIARLLAQTARRER
jgi:undecaprenyldiphospho-muramoylpentapeptide beta-N-acetylglucosaminyltransferase